MLKDNWRFVARFLLFLSFWAFFTAAKAEPVQGIYLSQGTLEDTKYLNYLIENAKAVGINTFVVDLERSSQRYKTNIALLKANNIRYVARIVVFPDGGRPDQIASPVYWMKRYELIKDALAHGAQEIQLDYIRYNTKQPASPENSKNIFKVIQWYKSRLDHSIPLQVDVFGIASFGESKHIGQNIQMIAQTVDAICPMVYPSHYEPYLEHAVTPYNTIYSSLKAIQAQFNEKMPVKLYAYIELSNYRYPLSGDKRSKYIAEEIQAVKDAGADGWYAWSAGNQYDYLFRLLAAYQNRAPGNILQMVEDYHGQENTRLKQAATELAIDKSEGEKASTTITLEAKNIHHPQSIAHSGLVSKETPAAATKTTSAEASFAVFATPLPWPLGAKYFIY